MADHYIPFWDDNNETVANEMMFTAGNLSLSVTAWTGNFDASGNQIEGWSQVVGNDLGVFRDDSGLGVLSSLNDGNDLDAGSSSDFASDPDEGLLFVFSNKVSIFDIFVGDLDSSDDINFSEVSLSALNDITIGNSAIGLTGPQFESEWPFEFNGSFSGSAFMVWVDDSRDDVEILGVATIPEPATIFVIALGLMMIGVRRIA
ncbi:PEP-CTERM sorting domain-containing protein [Flocculibacter collagenilyticus]|uniref:PEP-CTERM sorting domain-containing protein n=1 Tax=Flocculibacter collagenilyticus TaxID=2744479 RepID=UPI0018F7CDA5|nr:PEP-CTERM sorting domain-containing protein [Flocculibacter collagenilyticus]